MENIQIKEWYNDSNMATTNLLIVTHIERMRLVINGDRPVSVRGLEYGLAIGKNYLDRILTKDLQMLRV